MAIYRIRPIALCGGNRDVSHYAYQRSPGTFRDMAFYIWYIEGSKPKTIIDAGAEAVSLRGKGGDERDLISVENGLAKSGLKPEDIEIVIVTHLHFDHIELGYMYKNAKFIVQKKELDYARNPHPMDKWLYDKRTFENLNFETVNGQVDVLPGVTVFLSPGHTPGCQSVSINTHEGKAIIPGFCSSFETFEITQEMKLMGWEATGPLIHDDVREAYDSVLEIKQIADIIVPLHDAAFIDKETIP